jgi:hypothetical protein
MTTATVTTGTDVLRAALFARNAKLNLGGLARDLGLASATLEDFIAGRAVLLPEVLCAITKELLPGAEYDPSIDRLRPANKTEPRPMGIARPPIEFATAPLSCGPPRPVEPTPSPPHQAKPGWAD